MTDSFSNNLRAARIASGMSQISIANAIGVAKSTYSLYESGKRNPDIKTIKKMANVLGVSGDSLLGISDQPNGASAIMPDERRLLSAYRKLNNIGRSESIKRIEELAQIHDYIVN